MSNEETLKENITVKDIGKLIFIGVKVAIVLFAIFHASNVTILYQGF